MVWQALFAAKVGVGALRAADAAEAVGVTRVAGGADHAAPAVKPLLAQTLAAVGVGNADFSRL